ncbi:MAG: hypothetical protein AB7Q42_24105 [Acidimicrobiia bacterium]
MAVANAVKGRSHDDNAADADRSYAARYGGDEPSDQMLSAMQRSLRQELANVIAFADRQVAHRDPRGLLNTVTYGETIANDVSLLLRYTRVDYSLIVIEGDWHECFRPGLFSAPLEVYEWPDPRGFT